MAQAPTEARQRVLDTARRLFGERGYGGTALQAIADDLGLTKASVYYHFPAKNDLLEALAEPCLARFESVLTDSSDTSEPANCRTLLDGYLTALAECGVIAALLIGDPTVSTHLATVRFRSQRTRLRDALARAGPGRAGHVQATCCLGAVEAAVLDLPPGEAHAHRSTILDAAVRALAGLPEQAEARSAGGAGPPPGVEDGDGDVEGRLP